MAAHVMTPPSGVALMYLEPCRHRHTPASPQPSVARKTPGDGVPVPARARVLMVVTDRRTGSTFSATFAKSPVTIGRHRSCDLRLDQSGVARRHAEVVFDASGPVLLRNVAWRRATWIAAKRLGRGQAVKLVGDLRISVGPFEVLVRQEEPRSPGVPDDRIGTRGFDEVALVHDDRLIEELDHELVSLAADLDI